ncbi:hypothetical protein L211DRAFT_131564 [Terfezia boudieri ATCC MYA-4762]|uniref:Uncharacterized protein n=1 Tax=Terfezia boudieri ATCC MYA-4762 TaxID=1051890 RepID=A0A3N4LPX5_9PEZI|nr:hypothetical protein L211DRAFT_131564 [Terfezia boudieri ATCC MYA-4762]
MRATPYPSRQRYYSSPYQFYYTTTGRYCAYDAKSGTHLIHSLTDNRWYPYFPGIIPPSQQYSQQPPHPYNRVNDFQRQHYQHMPPGPARAGGARNAYPDRDQFKSREIHRDPVSRSHKEELLYSAADVEAAERSLIEESNIDNDVYFEDEGVDVRMGERIGRHSRPSNERQRQRSRSRPGRRNDEDTHRGSPYSQEASRARTTPGPQCQQTPGRVHSKHTQGQYFGSNHAGVGYEGSEHDSGYMDDFDPIPLLRRNMPGVARWLDSTPSEFSVNDGHHPFDVEKDEMRYASESNSRSVHTHKTGRGVISDTLLNKSYHDNPRTVSPPYHTEARSTQKQQNAQSRMTFRKDDRHRSSATQTLHRQDSGIDMSDAMVDEVDIKIDIHMEDASEVENGDIYPAPGCFPRGSPHPAYVSPRRSTHPRKTEEEFDCYYKIPPCPNLPPLEEPTLGVVEMVYQSGGQELTAPHSLRNPLVSPSFRQPDSVYTASVTATPRHKYHYTSPAMLPRAPTPPLSSSPDYTSDYTQRMRRSGLGVPIADYERRYTRPRW